MPQGTAGSAAATSGSSATSGAGGTSGASGAGTNESGGEGGNGGEPSVPSCIEITPSEPWTVSVGPAEAIYLNTTSPNIDTPADDPLDLLIYDDEVGSFDLSDPAHTDSGACQQCLFVWDGPTPEIQFRPVAGTLEISADSQPLSGFINAIATNVTFVQMNVYGTAPVPGGPCLHLATATITAP